jgi:hypothetical protein
MNQGINRDGNMTLFFFSTKLNRDLSSFTSPSMSNGEKTLLCASFGFHSDGREFVNIDFGGSLTH